MKFLIQNPSNISRVLRSKNLPPSAIDLLKKMMHKNPLKRPSVGEILLHPFFILSPKREFYIEIDKKRKISKKVSEKRVKCLLTPETQVN